ncbi:MAG TPA: universal stress protein [Thermoleophilaceae bacterium]|nr:universal stress protein [Thermoleophilaceae bacterium]
MALPALDQVDYRVRGDAQPARRRTAVVGHDGSATAAAVLTHAARRVGADGYLIVVHALPLGVSVSDAETGRAYASVARAVLRSIEAALPEGTSHETRIVEGPASKALLETAGRCGADEIVLGASPGRAARGAIGRVADSVLRRSELPVTIVPRTA